MKNLIFIILLLSFTSKENYAQKEKLQDLIEGNQWYKLIDYTKSDIASGDKTYSNFYWQYISYLKTNNIPAAINILKQASIVHADRVEIMSNLADLYFRENMYLKSKNILDSLLDSKTYSSRDIKQRCLIYEFYKQNSSAINLLHTYSKDDSLSSFYHIHLADNFRIVRENTKAINHYKRALKISNGDLKTRLKLVNIYIHEDPYKAIALCKDIIKIDTSNIRFIQKAAIAYIKVDSNKKALSLYKRCINIGDSSLLSIKNTGMLMQKTGDNKRASILLEKAYKIDSTNVNVSYYLAMALSKISELKKSIKYFNKSLDLLIPDASVVANIYYEQAVMYRKMGKNEESYKLLKLADEYLENDYKILYMIAEVYSRIHNNVDKVTEKYKKFLLAADKIDVKSRALEKKIRYVNYKIKSLKELKFMSSKGKIKIVR